MVFPTIDIYVVADGIRCVISSTKITYIIIEIAYCYNVYTTLYVSRNMRTVRIIMNDVNDCFPFVINFTQSSLFISKRLIRIRIAFEVNSAHSSSLCVVSIRIDSE